MSSQRADWVVWARYQWVQQQTHAGLPGPLEVAMEAMLAHPPPADSAAAAAVVAGLTRLDQVAVVAMAYAVAAVVAAEPA